MAEQRPEPSSHLPTGTARYGSLWVSRAVLAIVVLVGLALRLRMWLETRSLWLDPAMLALNLVDKNYWQLLGPLDFNQAAPFGFLWVTKLAGEVFGYSERALTLPSWIAGTAALLLFVPVARRVCGEQGAVFAVLPLAMSSTAVYYSAELKQYSFDLLATVLILLVSLKCLEEGWKISTSAYLVAAGVVATWFSHTAILVIVGALACLATKELLRRRGEVRLAALSGVVVLGHFGILYTLLIRPAINADLFAYHQSGFAPLSLWTDWDWYLRAAVGYLDYPLGFAGSLGLPLLGLGLGVIFLLKDRRKVAQGLLLIAPLLLLLLLSAAKRYPIVAGQHEINSRFLLFSLPLTLILIGVGMAALASGLRSRLAVIFLALMFAYPAAQRMANWPQYMRQEMGPLVEHLNDRQRENDGIFVYFAAAPAFRFYTRDQSLRNVRLGKQPAQLSLGEDIQRVKGGRLWVVMGHFFGREVKIVDNALAAVGRRKVSEEHFPGVILMLYSKAQPQNKPPVTD